MADKPKVNFDFSKYDKMLTLPDGDTKFAHHLVQSGRERLNVLFKNLKYLIECGDADRRDSYLFIIMKGIFKLALSKVQMDSEGLNDLVNGLVTESRHFSSRLLSNSVAHCLEYIKTKPDAELPTRWIEIFAKFVSLLSAKNEIDFENDILNGKEFKSQVVHAICRIDWKPNKGPSFIATLREIPGLSGEDVALILNKVTTSLQGMEPSSIPPLVYQLLLFVGDSRPAELITMIDQYFREPSDCAENNAGKLKVLGTAVYHFIQAARYSPNLLKEMMKRIKISAYDHNLVMNQFSLGISLGLTQLEPSKQAVVDGLKNTIVKCFLDSQLQEGTLWYKESYQNPPADVVQCFVSVLENKSTELDFMLDGLRDLAIGLLRVEEKDSSIGDRCKSLAIVIMTNVVQNSREYFNVICNKLLKNQNLSSIECLAAVIKSEIRTVLDTSSSGRVHELISHLPLMTVEMAKPLIKALLPALQQSSPLMGELIMILRKTLWKSVEARRVSVTAMTMLLSNLRIITELPKVADNNDDYLNDTQLSQGGSVALPTTEKSTANQLLCAEIVTILKRFFNQQCEVREHLYLGLDPLLSRNVELINDISGQLLNQVKLHMTRDIKSISLSKILEIASTGEVTVMEELGLLFQAVCSLILRAQKIFVGNVQWPSNVTKCHKLLDVWGTSILPLKLQDFENQATEMTSASGGAAKVFETVRYVRNLLIAQILQVIEALMEFLIFNGKLHASITIAALFEKFKELEKCLKSTGTEKKQREKGGGKAKKKKDENDKASDSNTTTSGSSATTNSKAAKKSKSEGAKKVVYVHIVTLSRAKHTLECIYSELDDRSQLRPLQHSQFENYLFRILRQKLIRLNQKQSLKEFDHGKKFTVKALLSIASVLWKRVLKKTDDPASNTVPDEEIVFLDVETGNGVHNQRLELIVEILQYLHTKHSNYRKRLIEFTTLLPSSNFEQDFAAFLTDWQDLFAFFQNSAHKQNMIGSQLLLSILNTLSCQLPPGSELAQKAWLFLNKTWLKSDIVPREQPSSDLAESVVKCCTTLLCKYTTTPWDILSLARNAYFILGDNFTQEQSPTLQAKDKTWLITTTTAPTVVHQLGLWVEKTLKIANAIVTRIKFHSVFISEGELSSLRDRCLTILKFVMDVLTELTSSHFPCGVCGDILLKVLTQFFLTMVNITEEINEFINKKKKEYRLKKFQVLVKLIGKEFKSKVESCVHHIELIQREQACELEEKMKANKKQKDKKVPITMVHKFTKDTRTIPALVYSIEKYDLQIISLAKKTKVDLLVGTKLSATRDFRIEVNVLKAAMRKSDSPTSFVPNITEPGDPEVADPDVRPNAQGDRTGTRLDESRRSRKRKANDPDE